MKKILLLLIALFLSLAINAQDSDKTVTLTVSGTGNTLEEAKTNALRSAIEQAFGAFISSKTEILNDSLVKDEIISVSNGNIQKFDVISQVEIPNIGYAMTINATVSISKLTSFAQSKGVSLEVKGGLFAANIIQQELNEKAELISLKNILNTSNEILKKSFDYSIETDGSPAVYNDKYKLPLKIKIKLNKNFQNFRKYFFESLNGLSIDNNGLNNYKQIKKSYYTIALYDDLYSSLGENYSLFYLRNELSINQVNNFLKEIRKSIFGFKVINNINSFDGEELYNDIKYESSSIDCFILSFNTIHNGFEFVSNISGNNDSRFKMKLLGDSENKLKSFYLKKNENRRWAINDSFFFDDMKNQLSKYFINDYFPNILFLQDKISFGKENIIIKTSNFNFNLNNESLNNEIQKDKNNLIAIIYFNDIKTLDEMKEISEYKIKPKK